jgi:hypothetical protein
VYRGCLWQPFLRLRNSTDVKHKTKSIVSRLLLALLVLLMAVLPWLAL